MKSPKPINVKNQEHLREYRKVHNAVSCHCKSPRRVVQYILQSPLAYSCLQKNKERKAEYDRMYYAKNKAAIKKHISDKKQEFIAEISKSYKDLSVRFPSSLSSDSINDSLCSLGISNCDSAFTGETRKAVGYSI